MFTLDLSSTTVAITGGSSGIGLATAALFLKSGAAVAICGRNEARLREAEAVLRRDHSGARLLTVAADVLDAAQMQAFAAAVVQTFGGADVLVNNAGEGRVSTFADTPDEAWSHELNLKFFSLIRPTRAFLPLLEKSPKAAIVCVNSLLALQPEPHMVATSAARAGAQNLVRSMATEFAPQGVRVNAILIGIVESGQWRRRFDARSDRAQTWEQWTGELAVKKGIPLGRFGKPEEAAQAILFLATPMSSYTTGTRLDISGGNSRHI